MTPAELLARVEGCGHAVSLDRGTPTVRRVRPGWRLPDDLLAELRANRDAVVEYLTASQTCPECGRETDAGDRERLAEVNPLCDRGYAKAVRDGNGVWHEASTPCPYRRSS